MSNVPPEPPSSLRGAVDLSGLVNRATQRSAAEARGQDPDAPPTAPGIVFESGDADFERVLQLSSTVPVLVEVWSPGVEPALGAIVRSYGGRLALATVDGSRNPRLVQALQVREVPTVVAAIGGQLLPLFVGIPADEELRPVLDQVLQVAGQQGVNGRIDTGEPESDENPPAEPEEPPLPPLHQEAYDAIERGDYAAAQTAYRTAIAQNPRDDQAVAGLAQVSLLARLQDADADAVRQAAADAPADLEAQLAVADLDVAGGHLDDAFDRLLDLFGSLDPGGRDAVRTRVLEYFELAGPEDPRVLAARRRLTSLLY